MSFLLDTNILVRLASAADARHLTASRAVLELHRRGETLHVAPQNLVEFRGVATGPVAVNGLGADAATAELHSADFEAAFPLLAETRDIYPAWKAVVAAAAVVGKQVHDARLIGVCHVYGITHLLTFDTAHFSRFAPIGPGVVIVDPATV